MQPPLLDSKIMVEICQELCSQAGRLPKRRRFEFFAARVPDPILAAIMSAAEALRHGNAGHQFGSLLYTVALEVRELLYERTAMYEWDDPGKADEWARKVGFALMFESLKRSDPSLPVRLPIDPFSESQLKACLGPVAREFQARIGW